jgi:hypothetical protein
MKRIVIKYRQAEGLLKSLQHKITINADVLELEQRHKAVQDSFKAELMSLEETIAWLKNSIEEKDR